MAKYTDQEKIDAVQHLYNLKREGTVSIDDYTQVSNVRDLCKNLGISSYSLYKWEKEVAQNPEKYLDILTDNPERSLELIYNETLEVIDEISEQNGFDFVRSERKEKDTRLIVGSEIRFFGNLAGMLGIVGYGSLPLKQLMLRVGLAIVKRSGLGGK